MNDFGSLVRHFKKEFPEHSFSVRRIRMPGSGYFGYCEKLPTGEFRICICRDIDKDAQLILLPHEVGHMLSWETDNHKSDHGRHFGAGYAKAWQSYLRWINA